MAVKTKARATTKASTKKGGTKASAKASSNGGQKRADARKRDKELMAKVVKERKADTSWGDIAKKHGITPGKAAFLVMISEVKPADRIKEGTDKELAKQFIALRLSGLGWGQIAARAYNIGIPEPRVKAIANEHATAAQRKAMGKNVAQERAASKPKSSGSGRKSTGSGSGRKRGGGKGNS